MSEGMTSGILFLTMDPFSLLSAGTLVLSLFSDRWAEGVYLHGSAHFFGDFEQGPHGLIYFSSPGRCHRRKTQAQHIAGGPFGGYLYEVKIRDAKRFDPLNDPRSREIALEVMGPAPRVGSRVLPEWERLMRVPYELAPEIVSAAKPEGYLLFEFWESAARCWSTAVADPSLVEVVRIHDVRGHE